MNKITNKIPSVDPLALHDQQVTAVTRSIAKMFLLLEPQGYSPESVFEGVVKGGAVAILARTNSDPSDVGKLLDKIALEFHNSGQSEGSALQ